MSSGKSVAVRGPHHCQLGPAMLPSSQTSLNLLTFCYPAIRLGTKERKKLGSKARPEMLQRLCDKFGVENENAIKSIMHVEYNNGRNRYKDLTVGVLTDFSCRNSHLSPFLASPPLSFKFLT